MTQLHRVLTLSLCAMGLAAGGANAQAQPLSADEAAALRAQIAGLKVQIAVMEQRLDAATGAAPVATAPPVVPMPAATPTPGPVKPAEPATTIAWKGAPQFSSAGRTFKPKGRIQADADYISHPDGLDDQGLGFVSEIRRIRLGGEGAFSDKIGYKLELELSDNVVDLVDTFITYQADKWLFTVGNHNAFWSLDELVGDTSGSFMERAAFTDAFNFERRLGVSAQRQGKTWLYQAGVFTDDPTSISNASDGPAGGDENNSYSFDQRLVFAPKVGDAQLHFGGSTHYRDLGRTVDAATRYRQRPFVHGTNSRLISTPALNVEHEYDYGLEAAAVSGPWHGAAEGYWQRADRAAGPDVTFFGAYAEVGYFLTGETRSYKNGIFAHTSPKRDIASGGPGSVQVNLRYDYLDLNDADVRGGTQNAVLASLIWSPVDNLRLNLNTGRLDYTGATPAAGRRNYHVYVGGVRIELDF